MRTIGDKIRKSVEQYKQQNGGTISFTTKELIIGLYDKVDGIEKRVYYNRAYIYVIGMVVIAVLGKLFVF